MIQIPALEGYLRAYESLMQIGRLSQEFRRALPPTEQYRESLTALNDECIGLASNVHVFKNVLELRNDLLKIRPNNPFPSEKYIPGKSNHSLTLVPLEIASWCTHSRRIFSLSPAMQEAFASIHMGNITMEDTVWPFPSFGIELAAPITIKDQGYGFILVSKAEDVYPQTDWEKHQLLDMQKVQILRFIPNQFRFWRNLDSEKIDKFRRLIKNKNFGKAADLYEGLGKHIRKQLQGYGAEILTLVNDSSALVENFVNENPLGVFVRIIANLGLYLDNLPSSNTKENVVEWKQEPRKDPQAKSLITDGSLICSVSHTHVLDSMIVDERSDKSCPTGRMVIPHWRRAHKRRPRGMGHIPDAEKTVKIPAVLVRADRVPEYGLPSGSQSIIKK